MPIPNSFEAAVPVRVRARGVTLSARAFGPTNAPTILFVHGFPDTSAVWSDVTSRLADRYRVVTYDVRGAGASDRPRDKASYRFAELVADVHAVIDALAPHTRVHLVGHDWGSIQGWEFVTSGGAESFASFTSISGPCLDHYGWLLREAVGRGKSERVESPHSERVHILVEQLRMSWYIALLTQPTLAGVVWRRFASKAFARELETQEGLVRVPGHPASTLAEDGAFGSMLYAANMPERLLKPRPDPRTSVPVQLVVAENDRFVSPSVPEIARPYVDDLRIARLDAGHWCIRSRAADVATLVDRFVRDIDPPT